jgi:hypothetical protein
MARWSVNVIKVKDLVSFGDWQRSRCSSINATNGVQSTQTSSEASCKFKGSRGKQYEPTISEFSSLHVDSSRISRPNGKRKGNNQQPGEFLAKK